jgi:hypothetical protein
MDCRIINSYYQLYNKELPAVLSQLARSDQDLALAIALALMQVHTLDI